MIALHDNLPLVKLPDGRTSALRRPWLRGWLLRAARKAGYADWWLADHVTESITTYLTTHYEATCVSVERLAKSVESVLQVIGYAEVAVQLEPTPPPLEISLPELARKAGNGYELLFFLLLKQRMIEALENKVEHVDLYGLHHCVKSLRSSKRWRSKCRVLQSEIVDFIRVHVDSTRRDEKKLTVTLH